MALGTLPLKSPKVVWFRSSAADGTAFQAISEGRVKTISTDKTPAVLAESDPYGNVTIVVWGTNQWRTTPVEAFTDSAVSTLQQYVRSGGDLVMFEQFTQTNMGIFDRAFGIKTGGAGSGAQVVLPALQSKVANAGLSDDMLKESHFYNSYQGLPPEAVVLVRDKGNRTVMAIVPYGKGRLILLGTNSDPSQKKLVDEVLDYIYHWKTQPPGSETGKVQLETPPSGPVRRSEMIGGQGDGKPFRENAPTNAVVVGFELSTKSANGHDAIKSVRAIYRGESGEFKGEQFGEPSPIIVRLVAKPGYAVGLIKAHQSKVIDGIKLHFMRLHGDALDSADSYDSDYFGGAGGKEHDVGAGKPVIGIFGVAASDCNGLGVITKE